MGFYSVRKARIAGVVMRKLLVVAATSEVWREVMSMRT